MAIPARFALIVGVLLLGSAVVMLVIPPPTRTVSLSPFDFRLSTPLANCEYSVPFTANAGERVAANLSFLYLWNNSLVHMFNGSGSVDAPMDACDGAAPLTRIPSDGQYVVAAVFTRPIYAGEQAVNATVLVEGTVTLARPDAYTVSQLVLVGGGLVLTVWGYSRKWPPRFLLKR